MRLFFAHFLNIKLGKKPREKEKSVFCGAYDWDSEVYKHNGTGPDNSQVLQETQTGYTHGKGDKVTVKLNCEVWKVTFIKEEGNKILGPFSIEKNHIYYPFISAELSSKKEQQLEVLLVW